MRKIFFTIFGFILVTFVTYSLLSVSAEGTEDSTSTTSPIQTGWIISEDGHKKWLDETGTPAIGWHEIGENTYCFDNNGYMITGKQFINNNYYLFGTDGILNTSSGLVRYGSDTYYILEDHSLKISDWAIIDGKDYYFDASANIVSGKQNIDGINYYFTEDSAKYLYKGGLIQARSGEWYYAEPNGQLATSTTKVIYGTTYYFDENSILQSYPSQIEYNKIGWQSIDGSWYYFNQDGSMFTGWLSYAGRKYYLYPDGRMATGWIVTNNHYQYLDSTGIQQFGWQFINGNWYALGNDGNMITGWLNCGDKKYYFHSDGRMATGWIVTNNHYQYLDSTGIQQFGWQFINGNWYALGNDGNMITGWLNYGDKKYYFHSDGRMATGQVWLDNKYQYFYANGVYAGDSYYRLLGVANYNQYAEGFPDGCEGVSLFQALQYKGYTGVMSLSSFMYTMPTSTNPFYGFAASGGYAAIFPPALANWGKEFSGGMTFDISGSSFDSLLEEVKNGNPVVAYVTTYYTTPTWRNYPFGPNLYNNHAVTLDGYDRINNLVHVSDPVSGAKWMDMFTVANTYDARKYAVVVR